MGWASMRSNFCFNSCSFDLALLRSSIRSRSCAACSCQNHRMGQVWRMNQRLENNWKVERPSPQEKKNYSWCGSSRLWKVFLHLPNSSIIFLAKVPLHLDNSYLVSIASTFPRCACWYLALKGANSSPRAAKSFLASWRRTLDASSCGIEKNPLVPWFVVKVLLVPSSFPTNEKRTPWNKTESWLLKERNTSFV